MSTMVMVLLDSEVLERAKILEDVLDDQAKCRFLVTVGVKFNCGYLVTLSRGSVS